MAQHKPIYTNIIDAWLHTLGDYFYFGYFDTGNLPLPDAVKNMYRHLMDNIGLTPETKVLNVGWGIGELEFYIYETHGCETWRVYHDVHRMEVARARCREKEYNDRIHFHTADSVIGFFPDNSFDVIVAFESSVFFNDKAEFMADCRRMLRNDGRMVFADTMLMKPLTLEDLFFRYQPEMLDLERTWGRMKMETIDAYRNKMEASGFSEVNAVNISTQTLPTLASWKETAMENRQQLLEVVPRENLDDFIASCDIMQNFFKDGLYCYGVLTGVNAAPTKQVRAEK